MLTWANLLNSLHNDQFAFFEAVAHDYITILFETGRDAPLLYFLFVIDQQDVVTSLIEQHGGLRNDKRLMRCPPLHHHSEGTAGDQHSSGKAACMATLTISVPVELRALIKDKLCV